MAEEVKITPDTEVKEDVKQGETIESITETVVEEKKEVVPETVPLAVFLDLKKDMKDLKEELKLSKGSSKARAESVGLSELAEKYPDVNPDFIKDMLDSATVTASKQIEGKYAPIIEKQEAKEKQAAFDKAFDNLFDKTLNDNPDLPKTVDKELVKELAMTPKYRNIPLSEVIEKLSGTVAKEKSSSEDEVRSGADIVQDVVSFDKITPEQKTAIMADPSARAKYFNWLDKQI